MNPDDLRRLAEDAESQRIERERERAEQQRADEAKWFQEEFEKKWAEARQAVKNLDSTVLNAAKGGARTAIVYVLREGSYLPRLFEYKKKEHWWTGRDVSTCKFVGPMPDYAQYVYDHCPQNLNPRWVKERVARTLELHVSW